MPINISDRKLSTLYKSLETTPNSKITADQALKILAEVADTSSANSTKMLAQLKQPGLSRDQQIALIKKGMSSVEKKDLATILDQGTVPMDADAKAFFEGVLDRGNPPPPPPNGLSVTGDQHNGLSGVTKAGATIEAINLSTAPSGRLNLDDTMVIGKADAGGKFNAAKLTGDQAVREGDLIRMRARYADGTTSDWVTVKAHGVAAADTNNAAVAVFRIGLTDAGNDKVGVTNINDGRQISEPGATLQFTNSRTGEKTKLTINDQGSFAAGTTLPGKPGDTFSVAASDGKNNTTFSTSVGNVTVPGGAAGDVDLVPDPALHKDELDPSGKPMFNKARFTGPLFVDGVKAEDVQQGQLGDCYFPSGMAAIAKANPDAIQKMIKDNGDGTYTVTFKQKDWGSQNFKDVPIKVDGDLYVRSYGGALYGHSSNSSDPKKMELWFPLIEKAYATWKGSYNEVGSGGLSSDVFEAVLGRDGMDTSISPSNKDQIWSQIKKSVDAKTPVSAGTYGDDQSALYTNTGVYADHSYSILGYEQSGNDKYVVLRNPWGESEPAGNGPNDGIFKLKLDEFAKLYQTLMFVN